MPSSRSGAPFEFARLGRGTSTENFSRIDEQLIASDFNWEKRLKFQKRTTLCPTPKPEPRTKDDAF